MALDRDGIQLVAEGAAEFIAQLTSADASLSSFIEKLSATSRIRTPQLAPDLKTIQEAAALAASAGGQLSDALRGVGQSASGVEQPLAEAVRGVQGLAEQLNAVNRITTAPVVQQITAIQEAIKETSGAAGLLRNQLQLGISSPGVQFNDVLMQSRLAQARAQAAAIAPRFPGSNPNNLGVDDRLTVAADAAAATAARERAARQFKFMDEERIKVAQAAAQFTARRAAAEAAAAGPTSFRVGRGGGEAETVSVERHQSALTSLNIALQRNIALIRDAITARREMAAASQAAARAEEEEEKAQSGSRSTGVSYLSTLSAIHAASFLLGNQTFTTAGSLTTLSLAFSKLGGIGVLFGASLGTVFVAVRSLVDAFQLLVNVAESVLSVMFQVGAGIGTAIAGGVALAVKSASDLETQFALIRGVAGGTDQQLGGLNEEVVGLSRTFGLSASDVAQAASLYIRAGGTIEEAINGATKAVVLLTTASAGELGAPQAARAVAQIKNAFGVGFDEAADFVAGLAQKTTLSFTEVTQAIQQVGPVAANAKIPLLDIGAAIGVAAEAGLRGTVAGSALKQVIADLAKPSKEANALLKQYSISLTDTNGSIRPLVDIFRDMNSAFGEQAVAAGRVTDAQRLYALTAIFGSRAGQAANIIAKAGAGAFLEMRDGIAAVSATDIANQLLIPTAKQLDITKQNALALATAFGGPLNAGLGLALSSFNRFLQSIGTQPFTVAGQAVVALATGSGFGKLSEALDQLVSDDNTRQFIDNVLRTLLTLRDTVTDTVVPAIVGGAETIGTSLRGIDVSSVLDNIARAGQAVGGVIAFLVGQFAEFVSSVIENRDRGAELRNTVIGLASAFGTTLVGGVALAAVPVAVMVTVLNSVGKAVLDVLNNLATFDSLWAAGWQVAQQVIADFFATVNPKFKAFADFLSALGTGDIPKIQAAFERMEAVTHADFSASTKGFKNALVDVNKELDALEQRREVLRNLQASVGPATGPVGQFTPIGLGTPESIQRELDQLTEKERRLRTEQQTLQQQSGTAIIAAAAGFKDLVKGAQDAATAAQDVNLSDIFKRGEGDLASFLSRIGSIPSAIDAATRSSVDSGEDTTTPGFLPSVDKSKDITNKIVEFVNDMTTRIANLEEDGANQADKTFTNAAERLVDNYNKFKQRIADIDRQTNERIAEIRQDAAIQRAQRDVVEDFQRGQEDEATARAANLEVQEQGHRNYLQAIQTQRQRDSQDFQRTFDIQIQTAQTNYQNLVAISDTAFQRINRGRTEAFQDSQNDQERAFRDTLKKAADQRQLSRELAKAKTPEERTNITNRAREAQEDAEFAKTQEKQLLDFQKKQRAAAHGFSDALEDQAFSRRIQQQIAEFNFRLALEVKAIQFRRDLEDAETSVKIQDDYNELFRRQGLATTETKFRRGQADDLKRLNDIFSDFNTERQIANIRRAGEVQKQEATKNFANEQQRNIREVFESLKQLGVSQSKSVRGVLDTINDKRDDFIQQAQKAGVALPPEFFQLDILENKVLELGAAFEAANAAKQQLLGQQFGSSVLDAKALVPSLATSGPLQVNLLPATASALDTASGLPPEIFNRIAQSVQSGAYDGINRAAQQGLLRPALPTIPNTGNTAIDNTLDNFRRAIQGTR